MASDSFSWGGFLLRGAAAFLLVYATYNPEGYSFFHWLLKPKPGETGLGAYLSGFTPLKALAGIGLVAMWAVFLQATRRSLGLGGAVLILAIMACGIWALIYYGAISPTSGRAVTHLGLVALAVVLAVGLSWSHITRRLSGQQDTDAVG
jgi:4-amino-4-deoxy-L-arabinose transferase-like glycosyltransferase